MIAEVIHPETGEKYTMDIPNLRVSDLERMKKEHATDQQIKAYIERLPVSAEIKALVFRVAKFTIVVGQTLVGIGKRVMEITMLLVNKYPNAGLGVILGALLASLIGAIPLLGAPLAAFLGPLLMLFGLSKGIWEDVKTSKPRLAGDISEASVIFQPLAG